MDAVCINQADLDERAHQVQMMREIYSHATRALVWLGPGDEGSDRVMRLIPRVREFPSDSSSTADPTHLLVPEFVQQGAEDALEPEDLVQFFSRAWFRRAWVVQEVGVSRQISVLCGHATVEWDDLAKVSELMTASVVGRTGTVLVKNPMMMSLARKDVASGLPLNLLRYLIWFRSWQSADARDKVFSLLGMVCYHDTALIQYTTSVEEVFKRTAVSIMKIHRTLDLLDAANPSASTRPLPNWVPDWGERQNPISLVRYEQRSAGDDDRVFKASHVTKWTVKLSDDANQLGVRGHLVDRVVRVSSLNPEYPESYDPNSKEFWDLMEQGQKCMKEFAAISKSVRTTNGNYITGETIKAAQWKTLLCGKYTDTLEPEISAAYSSFEKLNWLGRRIQFIRKNGYSAVDHHMEKLIAFLPIRIMFAKFFAGAFEFNNSTSQPRGRRFISTERGYVGLAPAGTQIGDEVGLFEGSQTPLIVKPSSGQYLEFKGCAYVHGIMQGELWDGSKTESYWLR